MEATRKEVKKREEKKKKAEFGECLNRETRYNKHC